MKVSQNYINLFHSETDHVGESVTFKGIRNGGMFREKEGSKRYFMKIADDQAIEVVMPSNTNKHGYMGNIVTFVEFTAVIKCRARLSITFMEGI